MKKVSSCFTRRWNLEFEDGVFPAPGEYEAYLTMKYGDWRADLPEEQQKGHELTLGDIEWKFL